MNKGSKKVLMLAVFITIAILLAIGYISAMKKTEPEFLSKIDKIMFDKKNKSPKFILTLPDKEEKKKGAVKEAPPATEAVVEEKKSIPTAEELLSSIPLLAKLEPIENQPPMPVINCKDEYCEKVGPYTLPKTDEKGTKPWMIYGKRENVQPNFHRVAVVVKNIGLDAVSASTIISGMPANVSISFSPYTVDAAAKIKEARSKGHETYADLLLPSKDVLKSDNGPMALSLTISNEENLERIKKILSVDAPLGGMIISNGVADNDNSEQLMVILNELQKRGLLIVDASDSKIIRQITPKGLAHKKAEIVIEGDISPAKIASQLQLAEQLAKDNGQVMVVVIPKPIALNAVNDWLKTFSPQLTYEQIKEGNVTIERPFALVPASNLVVE